MANYKQLLHVIQNHGKCVFLYQQREVACLIHTDVMVLEIGKKKFYSTNKDISDVIMRIDMNLLNNKTPIDAIIESVFGI